MIELYILVIVAFCLAAAEKVMAMLLQTSTLQAKVGENKRMAIGQTLIFPVIDDSG